MKKKLLEFSTKIYFFELDRKDKLNGRIPYITTLFIPLISIFLYYIRTPPSLSADLSHIIFWALVLVSIFVFGKFLHYLLMFLFGFNYAYIATPNQIRDYLIQIIDYNNSLGEGEEKTNVEEEFDDLFLDQVAGAAQTNSENNNQKQVYLNKIQFAIYFGFVLQALNYFPYILSR